MKRSTQPERTMDEAWRNLAETKRILDRLDERLADRMPERPQPRLIEGGDGETWVRDPEGDEYEEDNDG